MNQCSLDGFCVEQKSEPATIVIFGASGDLTARKLIPALFDLYKEGLITADTEIIGCARSQLSNEEFRSRVTKNIKGSPEVLSKFQAQLQYISGSYSDSETYKKLYEKIGDIEKGNPNNKSQIFYLSTPASLYLNIIEQLHANNLVLEENFHEPKRVIIEKPFGYDLSSAKSLDLEIKRYLKEHQIYRIDHYLGKETVQNILMLRFANMIFEPIWNNNYIDNVQITAAESIGVEHRAGYYETSGLLRDMFQNHMLTLLSLVAMEPPYSFESESIRNEKLKVLSSIRPITAKTIDKNFVRAQYTENNDENMVAYREEENVDPNSQTETYVAGTFFIDNWRWKDVPFLVRSGKRLKKRFTEIVITFKQVPHLIFGKMVEANLAPNKLRIKIQPDEAVCVTFNAKKPGPKLCMGHLEMNFKYSDVFGGETMDAYSRLILDAIQGDQTLFIRSDFILKSWELLTPVLQHWETVTKDLRFYESNSWGPREADELTNKFNTKWYND